MAMLHDVVDVSKAMLLARETQRAASELALQAGEARVPHLFAELSTRSVEIKHLKLVLAKLRRIQFGRRYEKLDQQIKKLERKLEVPDAEEGLTEAQASWAIAPRKPCPAHLQR
jgi:hypothetical protein